MHLVIVGATGMVGRVMLEALGEYQLRWDRLTLVASDRSAGKTVTYQDQEYVLHTNAEAINLNPDIAIFSAGGSTSLEWAPQYAGVGCRVIDNSSAWRMDPDKKLIVPEINGHILTKDDYIIANPNCSTIQLVVVLKPLSDRYGLRRLIISTYQAVSGTGAAAVNQLDQERKGNELADGEQIYPYPIDNNCIPHCDVFFDNGYTREELKLVNEPRKILGLPDLRITATAVRVPVVRSHSEAVNLEMNSDFDIDEIRNLLNDAPGVVVLDDPKSNTYPMPLFAQNSNDVFVGRIRRDESQPNSLNMWVVSDNLRKGAATNALQIADIIVHKFLSTSEVVDQMA
ncbi:UNVERIFIED_CONTAM: hypothetical protein GTU68_004407 [Idotea baltica]|nr:hypothetical protein [Idotea baltica]